jgi:predicted RNase H-like nuclease (RuvC/YqgF family)
MAMNTETEILRKNVKELQIQLRDAHIRIKELNLTINTLRNRLGSEIEFTTADGWAMPVENPDAIHIKEDKDE